MSIAEKLLTIAESQQDVYDAGKAAEYDRFWDAFQNKGERTVYWYGFSGYGWTNDTLCPKHPITFSDSKTAVSGLFYRCGGNDYDTSRPFETCIDFSKIQDKFDFSRTTDATDTFNSCFMVNIYANLANCTATQRTFARTYGGYMENITVKVSEKLTNCSNMFQNCGATNIIFTEDSVIACNGMNFSGCKLTQDSLISIVAALQNKTDTGATGSITFGANNVNNLTDTEKAILSQKGWSYT